jgi:asparagine synthase (glutamine-hydrolysing)
MCGIAGIMTLRAELSSNMVCDKITHSIQHRGPDKSGLWKSSDGFVTFLHTRLSILDLSSAGDQPMISKSGRYVITFNGEIYNHLELRKKIKNKDFRGHSDTETLLACIDEWGLYATLKSAVGMFSLALWDVKTRELHLARDRVGEKPLYYGWQGELDNAFFIFGSELKSLKAHPLFKPIIDRNSISLLLRHNCIPAPHTIYQKVFKLLPGTILSVSLECREPKFHTYWSAKEVAENGVNSLYNDKDVNILNKLEELLKQSVRRQTLSDVPLGAFLSGGVDSSLIVALMQKYSTRPVKTFTIGFFEDEYNEAKYAKKIARHLKTDHTELYVSPEDVLDIIPQLPTIYDEPFSDSSQIPTFLVSKLAQQHVTVSLSGDGADEIFCGYNRYLLTDKIWGKLSLLPVSVRHGLANAVTKISPRVWSKIFSPFFYNNIGDKIHKAASVLDSSSIDEVYLSLVSHWTDPESIVLKSREHDTILKGGMPSLSDLSQIQKMMLLDLLTYLPDDILVKVDRAAMSVSLETRCPFLDHNIIDFAWHMPMNFKIRNGDGKWALRQILYKYVPKDLIDRPKMGFGIPIDSWLRGPLRGWAENLLDESRLIEEGYFNPKPIREKWMEHLSGKKNWQYQLWDVLMFQAWLESQ